ncbi:MAG: hypothetical protein HY580_03555, partial [Nitrospinae bacterium]|nr:hypothetical protein [Nitrospinota bacterium]
MNFKKLLFFGLILGCAGAVTVLGCGEAKKEEPQKPLGLAMDLPKAESDLKMSKEDVAGKGMPEVKKSGIAFKFDESRIKKKIAETPVTDQASCIGLVAALEKKKDVIQRNEGMWGFFEQTGDLKIYSPLGMQLDSDLNKTVRILRYLCNTAKGVPYTYLADLVNRWLETGGEKDLREKFDSMGESPKDVEIYLKYGAFAKKIKDRAVEYSAIQDAVLRGELFVDKYSEFAQRLAEK